ncbi:ABC transporter permease [Pantoea eucrina]|uniref:ABC transporter permease n=1 Tax=Pantoea eucrina TaxID=472693 RepID=A0ABU5LJI7_9GAMM|nr:ABC transporter permease [Pantoea eucrina]MDZ7280094.1 ABC transporter permease [Pantoea eucrina]
MVRFCRCAARKSSRTRISYGPSFTQILLSALESIRHLGRRAVLAFAGIAAGCAAVVALINVGTMAQLEAANVFKGMGSNVLIANLQPAPGQRATGLLPGAFDPVSLRAVLPAAKQVAATVISAHDMVSRAGTSQSILIGAKGDLMRIMGLSLQHGRFLGTADADSTYIVLGNGMAQGKSLGDRVRMGNYVYEVVGILAHRDSNPLFPFDPDSAVFLSASSMKRLLPAPYLTTIMVQYSRDSGDAMADPLKTALLALQPGLNVNVQVPALLLNGIDRQSQLFRWLLLSMAGISLLGGGIGVMNVMMMNVAERKKEIGVRLALGARTRDIAVQFLLEALVLSALGALAGCLIGMAGAGVFYRLSDWTAFSLSLASLLLGAGSSLTTGLFFGLYPALAAAKIEPVRALNDA